MSGSKINVAKQAIDYIKDKLHPEVILGIGTGSTVNFFIEELAAYKNFFSGAVSSSEASSNLLKEKGIKVFDLNDILDIEFYICLLYTSPSPRDATLSRMPSSA